MTDTTTGAAAVAGRALLTDDVKAELRQIVARYPHARSALLPMLHLVQSVSGQVTPEGIETCAEMLDVSTAEVSGVATFYTMYKRRQVGDYHVGVCTNTLCAVLGGDEIFDRLKSHLDIGNDETTDDGRISLEHLECNAACDYAPVVMVNWEFFDDQTPESAVELVDALRAGQEVRATRGARVCTWREAERVLAGFPDGRADEGPAAGPATLVGLTMARREGWTAPAYDAQAGTADGDDLAESAQHASTERAADSPSPGGAASADDGTSRAEEKVPDAGTPGQQTPADQRKDAT